MSVKSELVSHIIDSLESEPQRWEFGRFEAERDDGICIWTANRSYGLTISADGIRFGTIAPFFGWLGWQGRVFRATQRAALKRLLAKAEGQP